MRQYFLTNTKRSDLDFTRDLERLGEKHGTAVLDSRQCGVRDVEGMITTILYEVPTHGAIEIRMNYRGKICGQYSGMVSCLGFDESSERFKAIDADLEQLSQLYILERDIDRK